METERSILGRETVPFLVTQRKTRASVIEVAVNQPSVTALSELIDQYGGRLVLEAVADYCFQHLGLRCFAAGFGRAPEQLLSADDSRLRKNLMAGR